MSKPLKSQWDFGELFPPEAIRRVFTVTELTTSVRRLLERELGKIWVTGEITNLRSQASGHIYFSLKDTAAQLSCVLFRGEARSVNRDLLRDGERVTLQGDLTVFEARGQYQLIVAHVELQGTGALQVAFERLKQKLQTEGLFAIERKRALPLYPQRIGIATSASGAALRDVIHVIRRRAPSVGMIVAACRVQGQGAAGEIACAVRLLNAWNEQRSLNPKNRIDLILVTRGGGSLEDLWAFNEETLARAIFESKLPVVSAVGHEIDFTISDFVADIRAATPSAAAELITEGVFASREFISDASRQLRKSIRLRLASEEQRVVELSRRLARAHPRRWIQEQFQRLDDLQSALVRCAKYAYRSRSTNWRALLQRFLRVRPSQRLTQRAETLCQAKARLQDEVHHRLRELRIRLTNAENRLRLLSPENVLKRGYSITRDLASGRIIRGAKEVTRGQKLKTHLGSGEIRSVVED
jgi:exodeoxyribonuclease VII large subunit